MNKINNRRLRNEKGVLYLNSGDWIENLTAVEFVHSAWTIYHYNELDYDLTNPKLEVSILNSDLDDDDVHLKAPQAVFLAQFFDNQNETIDKNQLIPIKK